MIWIFAGLKYYSFICYDTFINKLLILIIMYEQKEIALYNPKGIIIGYAIQLWKLFPDNISRKVSEKRFYF